MPGTPNELLRLINRAVLDQDLRPADLATRLYDRKPTSTDIERVRLRLVGKTAIRLDEVAAWSRALGLSIDEVVRTLWPALPSSRSMILTQRDSERTIADLSKQLALLRTQPTVHLGVIRAVLEQGGWSVGILPAMSGPEDSVQVLDTLRLALTPTTQSRIKSDRTARQMLMDELGFVFSPQGFFITPTSRPVPEPPIKTDPHNIIHVALPVFSRDRPVGPAAIPLPKLPVQSIFVTSVTSMSSVRVTSAVVARALDWGLEDARSVGRLAYGALSSDTETHIRQLVKLGNDGIRRFLAAPALNHVISHFGHGVCNSGGEVIERHALLDAIEDRDAKLPFVILLRESDRMLRRQIMRPMNFSGRRTEVSDIDIWKGWRDQLEEALRTLELRQGGMVIDVDFPWVQENPEDRAPDDQRNNTRLLWQETAYRSEKIIRRLLTVGSRGATNVLSNDPEARSLLDWVSTQTSRH